MPKLIDLTGKTFGKLTVLCRDSNKKKKTYWICKCECGKKVSVQGQHLREGSIKSCGCDRTRLFIAHQVIRQEKPSICQICGKQYYKNNMNRKYCYECVPQHGTPTEIARWKAQAVKHQLVLYKGGKCEKCGYDKCEGALQFHHLNPAEKEFSISDKSLNGTTITIETLEKEADKCLLLCANCHAEIHWGKK